MIDPKCIKQLANAITPLPAVPGTDAAGGSVSSLTEAVMGVTDGLADAVSGRSE